MYFISFDRILTTDEQTQCAAVIFVSGSHSPPSVCKNVTGLSASFTADPTLSVPATATASTAGSTSSSATTTSGSSASASAISQIGAASTAYSYGGISYLIGLAAIVLLYHGNQPV
jgi:hypothetical protein